MGLGGMNRIRRSCMDFAFSFRFLPLHIFTISLQPSLSLSLSLSLSQAIEEFIAKKAVLDIEIGLGSPFPLKGEMLSSNCVRDFPELIIIDDDDNNDGQRYSSRSSTELQPLTLFPCTSSWVISEEDLELRLGFKAHNRNPVTTINFFDDGSEQQSLQAWKSFKQRKLNSQTSSSHCLPDGKEVKLRCNICMDTMKEETSTTCGHIFCKQCITDAIRVQKRCPTCRERLSPSNIHRIYLPGATS
ncbi:hypothetical protein MRB53_027344 [Persea americana]|uniref:Uncharacterized protein n=1 Tax=Persea americana TaxID=3435 RepID=A0ACC2LLB5_PERAE|nr:hypothetical protein MRB53_027344 [Persea americana]